jgi:hypothetical protein
MYPVMKSPEAEIGYMSCLSLSVTFASSFHKVQSYAERRRPGI